MKLPIVPTFVVGLAVAVMVALGIWQLQRAQWKDSLIERYSNADELPPISFPTGPGTGEPPLFRWATAYCHRPVDRRAVAGQNRAGESGYVHIVGCSAGAEGPGIAVEVGWSKDPNASVDWPGGPVTGMIAPDRERGIRLVAATAPPGLQPSAMPSVAAIPRNHRMYAATWFAFALIALVIYGLALARRSKPQ